MGNPESNNPNHISEDPGKTDEFFPKGLDGKTLARMPFKAKKLPPRGDNTKKNEQPNSPPSEAIGSETQDFIIEIPEERREFLKNENILREEENIISKIEPAIQIINQYQELHAICPKISMNKEKIQEMLTILNEVLMNLNEKTTNEDLSKAISRIESSGYSPTELETAKAEAADPLDLDTLISKLHIKSLTQYVKEAYIAKKYGEYMSKYEALKRESNDTVNSKRPLEIKDAFKEALAPYEQLRSEMHNLSERESQTKLEDASMILTSFGKKLVQQEWSKQ